MKFLLSGASSTGKSTTAKILSEKTGLPIIDNISRTSPYEMHTVEHQKYMADKVFETSQLDNHIMCRTPFDVWAYSIGFNIQNHAQDSRNAYLFAKSNPIVIYFPINVIPIVDDGFRPVSEELNSVVDSEIRKQLMYYGVKYHMVGKGTPEERAENIIKFMEESWQE